VMSLMHCTTCTFVMCHDPSDYLFELGPGGVGARSSSCMPAPVPAVSAHAPRELKLGQVLRPRARAAGWRCHGCDCEAAGWLAGWLAEAGRVVLKACDGWRCEACD
jgi:hypothetical protein